jgi:hypothetical protein
MTQNWRHLPAPARPIAAAALEAVAAARHRDNDGLAAATAELAALDPVQVGLILGTAVRVVLEDTHPDGVDGDDVRVILERCARGALAWHADVDPHVLLILLAGSLGVYEDDGEPLPSPESRARHAGLLLADLIGDVPGGDEPAAKQVTAYLTAALAEIERAQLND